MFMVKIKLTENKKVFFASDFHLGAPTLAQSIEREKKIIHWLESIEPEMSHLFLVGDLFDFWFEYKRVVPKGFTRFLGKLAQLADNGVEIYIFKGNHDMWMEKYLADEIGCKIYRKPQVFSIQEHTFYVAHGDGFGPGDYAYKFLKQIFENPLSKFLFGRILHANLGQMLGHTWAGHSWKKHEKNNDVYQFESFDKELLFQYAKTIENQTHHDFYVFGHRHFPFDEKINSTSRYINLGDWIQLNTYFEFDGTNGVVKKYQIQT